MKPIILHIESPKDYTMAALALKPYKNQLNRAKLQKDFVYDTGRHIVRKVIIIKDDEAFSHGIKLGFHIPAWDPDEAFHGYLEFMEHLDGI